LMAPHSHGHLCEAIRDNSHFYVVFISNLQFLLFFYCSREVEKLINICR